MSDSDEEARKARAEQLRKQIERLIEAGDPDANQRPPDETPAGKSPREFIGKKMQEETAARRPPIKRRGRKSHS